jgi:hypothetical protein
MKKRLMMSILKKIKNALFVKKLLIDEGMPLATKKITSTEDTQDSLEKQLAEIWESQRHRIENQALISHEPTCPDIFNCKKNPCFKPEPDKIVRRSVVTRNKRSKTLKELEEPVNNYE